jgi:hypothetical protein
MIGFLFRLSVKLFVLSALLYITFFVPVANRTVFEHLKRIAATKEAKELGSGLESAALRVKDELARAVVNYHLGAKLNTSK